MLLLALSGTVIHFVHGFERQDLNLAHEPGTIASAVSIGARTFAGDLLAGQQRPEDIYSALRGRKFRINTETMKIVMEGEEGYDDAASPGFGERGEGRRFSVFSVLQAQGRPSKRFSRPPKALMSPRSSAV
jgi:hypothetical protein